MFDWERGRRERARRIDALEREVESLRAKSTRYEERFEALAENADSLAERLSTLAGAVSPLTARVEHDREEFAKMRTSILSIMSVEVERVQQISTNVSYLLKSVESLQAAAGPAIVSSLEKRAKEDREDMAKTRTSILRLERELQRCFEESRKAYAALLERIETTRPR